MAQLISPDYGQQFLFPPALEDWVPLDHPARFLREFVDQLDLPVLGFAIPSGSQGRPPYAPGLLLKIRLYGCFHRIRSTRKLEVACEAGRQETDAGRLVPMMEQARENLGVASLDTLTLADMGYGAGADLQAAQEKQLPVPAPPLEGKPAHDNPYASQHFNYDSQHRTVACPQGRQLEHEGHTTKAGQRVERYRCHCRDCPARSLCTRDPKGRQIEIRPHAAVVQAMRAQLREPSWQALYQQRSRIIERPFGQIKQHDGFRRWTVWGLEAVRTQWSLLCATLNLRVLYRRWRQRGSASPKSPAAMMGTAARPAGLAEALFQQAQKIPEALAHLLRPYHRWQCDLAK